MRPTNDNPSPVAWGKLFQTAFSKAIHGKFLAAGWLLGFAAYVGINAGFDFLISHFGKGRHGNSPDGAALTGKRGSIPGMPASPSVDLTLRPPTKGADGPGRTLS